MEIKKAPRGKLVKTAVTTIAAIVFVAAIGSTVYLFTENKKIKQDPNIIAKQETNQLVNKVGKLMDLPSDETPSIATVTDKEKLKDQPFFAKSENGDKVLIYAKTKTAILYRPSTDKIITVMPISFSDNQAAKPAEETKVEDTKTNTKK
uniref:Uncharacterized protein n=1 Tax=candidate division CPR3 bacterium TaxID=2268181 RepID=A0A7C4R7W8_UNCC3